MGLFSWFTGLFDNQSTTDASEGFTCFGIDTSWDDNAINPANGLPMVGGMGGVDVEGNAYGTDFSHENTFDSGSGFDDSFGSIDDSFSSGNTFDDPFSSIDDSFSSDNSLGDL